MTLRAVARLGNACNVFGDPETVRHKFAVMRRHCDAVPRNYDEIERTNLIGLLLARDEASLSAKAERLGAAAHFRGFAGTVRQATDLIGQYAEAGVHLLISSAFKNDTETLELLAAEIMPHFV